MMAAHFLMALLQWALLIATYHVWKQQAELMNDITRLNLELAAKLKDMQP